MKVQVVFDEFEDSIFMKYLIAFFLLVGSLCPAQTWQETSIGANLNGQRYDDVFFLNENLGWAANGFYSAVYKTTDGGLTWTEQLNGNAIPGNYYFRNINFLNENIGFLGTLNGSFFKTLDGGDTWEEVTNINPNPNAICGIDTVGNSTVYGCGAYFTPACIIKSTDSGESWSYTDMSAYANGLVEVLFQSETVGYAGGRKETGACLLKTSDGGETWTEVFSSDIPGEIVWKLQFINDNPNIIYGALYSVANNPGKIIKSTNGGDTWTTFDAPETGVQAIGFINENTGWMGGHNTGFYETTDGGESWTNLNIGSNLNRIVILANNLAYASGTSIYKFTEDNLGITEFQNTNKGLLQPELTQNPIQDKLIFYLDLKVADNVMIDIYGIDGTFIQHLDVLVNIPTNTKRYFEFDIGHLSSGGYLLNLHNNLGQSATKFIKQ